MQFNRDVTRIILVGIGITSLSSLVYLAGPLIAIGGYHPLQSYIVREIAILLLIMGAASFAGFSFYRRKKSGKALAAGVSDAEKKENDELVLKDKMKDALATLRIASKGKKDYLYDLPWYLLIGPPGSGKTTALINSGLKFPLLRGATPAAIAGVGGTRYCDWWFTEEAVLIDTAGRYTTQDSDAAADKESWFAFLGLLKKNRPRQPINGVIVAISLEDLMTLSQVDLSAHSSAIRTRLLELHDGLKVDFPVYAVFTKGDLIAGFMEYFNFLDEMGRKQVWGATFQTADKSRNMVSEIAVEYDTLLERLSEDTLDRLQDEPVPNSRVLLFGFPAQMARLKQSIHNFLSQIFEPTRYHANATLRGFYLTSGTQQGSPIDQLIGALVKSFGAEGVSTSTYSGQGKSYFLHDLILKVIVGEAAWVSTDPAAVRRALILKTAALSLIALFAASLSAAWFISFQRNRTLIEQTQLADKTYAADAGPYAKETLISDRDLHKVLPLLQELRNMPAGYAVRTVTTPLSARYGLSQRERLQSSSENAYRIGLERLLRPRLIYRLEEQLGDKNVAPGFLYEGLKVYLMLGGLHPADRELIRSWMQRDWAENLYPGAANGEGRKLLQEHLDAMLDLESGPPLIQLNGRLIAESQKSLARMSIAQRAYELLKSQARTSTTGDWTAAQKGGPDVTRVFEAAGDPTLESVRVPEFFTYDGFQHRFIDRLADITDRVKRDRWVLGEAGEQPALTEQYNGLADELLALYTKDFIATWQATLSKLRLRKLTGDKPQYNGLSAISAPTSPLMQLIESIRSETMLTHDRGNQAKSPVSATLTPKTAAAPTAAVLFKTQNHAPGAEIEDAFRQYQVLFEGTAPHRPIDDLIANLNEITQALILAATTPSRIQRAIVTLQDSVAKLRNSALRLPKPFSEMMANLSADIEREMALSSAGQIQVALRDQVTPFCLQTIANHYPFVRGSSSDVPLADFARLFGPGGVMDTFFKQYLDAHADRSKPQWTWRQNTELARTLSLDTLHSFQRAAEIRDAFFQTGGNVPVVQLSVKPDFIPDGNVSLEIGGTVIGSPPATNNSSFMLPGQTPAGPAMRPASTSPVLVQWPGASLRAAISTAGASGQPSILERTGPWSLFRLLEAGAVSVHGEIATATFAVGGSTVRYDFVSGSSRNPLNLATLRSFKCPSGI